MSLEEDIRREKDAQKNLELLADELAEACSILWRMGDGDGGYVLSVIKKAFHDCLGQPLQAQSNTRKRDLSKSRKKEVLERDAYRCVKCGSHINLCVDHIHPWSLGGSNEPENLQTLCWICNSKKSNKVEE